MSIKLIGILCVTAALSACNGSGGGGSTSSSPNNDSVISKPVLRPVFLDDMGVIPVGNGISGQYTLNLNNVSDENYVVESISVSPEDGKLVGISSAVCTSLPAKGYCSIQVTPKTNKSGSVLLTVNLRDSKDELKVIHQLIRMSNEVSGRGISFKSDLGTVVTPDGNYSISVPIVLEKDFTDIKAAYGRLLCSGFTKGNTCTLTMSGKSLGDKTLVSAHVTGYENKTEAEVDQDTTLVKVATDAHLIVQHGTEVQVGKTAQVKIFNNGGSTATAVSPTTTDPALQITSQCTEVAANNSCEFSVEAKSLVHGTAPVKVEYHNGKGVDSTSTYVTYFAERLDAQLKITPSSTTHTDFENLVAKFTGKREYEIKNTGKIPVTNFAVKLLSSPSTMKMTDVNGDPCSTLSVLDPGKTCKVTVTYAPQASGDKGDAFVRASGKYKTVEGIEKPYLISSGMKYSSIDGANILSLTSNDDKDELIVAAGLEGTKDYTLKQTSSFSSILTAIKLQANLNANPATDVVFKLDDKCNSISNMGSCDAELKYNPVPAKPVGEETIALSATYDIVGPDGNTIKAFNATGPNLKLTTLAVGSGTISTNVEVLNKDILIGGDGSSGNPYSFIASTKQQLELEYTFTNISQKAIDKFYLDHASLGKINVTVNGCGDGTTQKLDASGGNCKVKVIAPSKSWLDKNLAIYQGNNTGLVSGQFNIPLTYHFDEIKSSITKSISFTRDSANVRYTASPTVEAPDKYTATITATAGATKLDHDVNISLASASGITATTCTIKKGDQSKWCNVTVTFQRPDYDGMDETDIELVATEANGSTNDPIHTELTVELATGEDPGIDPDAAFISDGKSYKFELSGRDVQIIDASINDNGLVVAVTATGKVATGHVEKDQAHRSTIPVSLSPLLGSGCELDFLNYNDTKIRILSQPDTGNTFVEFKSGGFSTPRNYVCVIDKGGNGVVVGRTSGSGAVPEFENILISAVTPDKVYAQVSYGDKFVFKENHIIIYNQETNSWDHAKQEIDYPGSLSYTTKIQYLDGRLYITKSGVVNVEENPGKWKQLGDQVRDIKQIFFADNNVVYAGQNENAIYYLKNSTNNWERITQKGDKPGYYKVVTYDNKYIIYSTNTLTEENSRRDTDTLVRSINNDAFAPILLEPNTGSGDLKYASQLDVTKLETGKNHLYMSAKSPSVPPKSGEYVSVFSLDYKDDTAKLLYDFSSGLIRDFRVRVQDGQDQVYVEKFAGKVQIFWHDWEKKKFELTNLNALPQ